MGGAHIVVRDPALPRLPATAVRRPRLDLRLAGERGGLVTVVRGPAGSGKTVLLAQHAADRPRTGWVTLTPEHRRVDRFRSALSGALAGAGLGGTTAPEPSAVTSLDDVVCALSVASRPVTLVLDDLHLVAGTPVEDDLAYLAELGPPALSLVVGCRGVPALPLPLLRVRDRLIEVDGADLRWHPDEARALFHEFEGVALADDEIAVLVARTEGWAAGLQLAALSLVGRRDPSAVVQGFGGTTPVVADYLRREVLDHQAEETRDFLLRSSVLDELDPAACEAVTGRPDAAAVLHDLAARGDFVLVAGTRGAARHRYHPLFRDLLRRELHDDDPAGERQAHAAAARAYARHGDVEAAIPHHLAAGEPTRAWALLRPSRHRGRARIPAAASLLGEFSAEFIDDDPARVVDAAVLLAGTADPALRAAWIGRAERSADVPPPSAARVAPHLALLRVEAAAERGDLAAVIASGTGAAPGAPARPLPSWALGHLAEAHLLSGRRSAAAEVIAAMIRDGVGWPAWDAATSAAIAELAWVEGRLRRATGAVARASACPGGPDRATRLRLELVRGAVAREACSPSAPRVLGAVVEEASRQELVVPLVLASIEMAMAEASDGRPDRALERVRRLHDRFATPLGPPLLHRVLAAEAQLRIGHGAGGADEIVAALPAGHDRTLLEARLALGRGRDVRGASARLAALRPSSVREQTERDLVRARVALARGATGCAVALVRAAVERVGPDRWARSFVDEGADIALLLQRLATGRGSSAVARLLARIGAPVQGGPDPAGTPLTRREIDVLRMLATDGSLGQVARDLDISPNTCRTHVRSVYQKLGVRSRAAAVAVALADHLV